jgi:hypothetical protein
LRREDEAGSSVPAVILFIIAIPLALIVVGYRDLAAAWNPRGARGVLSTLVGVGVIVWLLNNITW